MLSEPRWLEPSQIVDLNKLIVAATGEPFAMVLEGKLKPACWSAWNHWHYDGEGDVAVLATRLLFAVADGHIFAQGNKRTGFEAALIFLELNGYDVTFPDDEVVAQFMLDVINGIRSEPDFANFLEHHMTPL